MTVEIINERRSDEMAREIVAFVRERYSGQDESVVLASLWLAFQGICGPLEAGLALRAYMPAI